MAENPLAIRVSEEVKALFNELAEQGEFENKGEFLNRLLTLYQSETIKQDVSIIKPAIETVEILTTRLLEVLNGTASAITIKEEQYKQELDEQKKSFDETRALLQRQITSLEQERLQDEERLQLFIQDKEQAELRATEFQNRIKELDETINDKTALVEEYKRKNDNLSGIVSEYKAYAEKSKELEQTNLEFKRKIDELENQIKALNEKSEERAARHVDELERLKDTLNIENEKAILELRTEHQKDLQTLQTDYRQKLNDYEENFKSLLFEKAQEKPIAKASASSRKKSTASKSTVAGTEPTEPTEPTTK